MSISKLADIEYRLRRADEHLADLKGKIRRFIDDGAYAVGFDHQFDGEGTTILRAQVLREPPSVEWGVVIGELIHDVRSSLDHLAFLLTASQIGPPPAYMPIGDKWRKVSFPIVLDKNKFPIVSNRALFGFPQGWWPRTRIEQLQPFECGKDRDPLWLLEEMWNADKHRVPHLVGFIAKVTKAEIVLPPADDPFRVLFEKVIGTATVTLDQSVVNRPFEDGAEIGRITTKGGLPSTIGPEMYVKLDIMFDVALEQGPPAYGQRVIPAIAMMIDAVSSIVREMTPFV